MGPLSMSVAMLAFVFFSSIGAFRTGDEALEERLVGEILVVLLEVLLGGGGHLQGDELVATLLETLDDVANKAALLKLAFVSAQRSADLPERHQA